MAHVSNAKKEVVAEYKQLIKDYPIVGTVNMSGLPAAQLQNMREQLRTKIVLKVGKRRLISLALEETDNKALIPYLEGQPALLFTKDNPFELFKILKANKSTAPAKAGQIAPKDIIVPAGPTSFAPGPIIGELGSLGIKAGIEGGKIAIKADAVVAKKGDVLSAKLAGILTRLGIEPMEVGLDLTAVYENGELFEKSILDINEEEYINNITKGHTWAFNLAIDAGIYNTESVDYMIQKAARGTKALAISRFILADGVVGDIISRTYSQMLGVASQLNDDALSDDLRVALSASSAASVAPIVEEKKDDDKKEPEAKADSGFGLGSLFG